jgi:rubrerythrin
MSRQKSNRTLLIEQERATRKEERDRKRAEKVSDKKIREERREFKRAEREAKREERLKKKLAHESVERNGVPKVQSGGMQLGIRDAIAYAPFVLCGGCGAAIKESEVIGDLCPKCKYGKEVESEKPTSTEQGDKAVPGQGDGGSRRSALAGQLILTI